ncbi:glycosyltransferase family 4 protein [Ectobacillus polymachus]|uniref:glycosyltransferase family 4 protein n=1 Tax=Ectobacillus polymachus TaxID=1508806 RepID=UPI003A8B44E6
MKKVLFVATVVRKHINVFHLPYLKWFKENGYETHVCARNDYENKEECVIPYCDRFFDLPFERSPFKVNNLNIYKQLKILVEKNNYDIIHCHTPMGGALTRIAAKKSRKNGTRVIYTAHGFHFFEGAPLKNWFIYFPIEKWLSKYTDCLITINQEDYQIANRKFKTKSIRLVNGVGISINKFKPYSEEKKLELRREYGYKDKDFILIYAGELSYRKNQDLLIKTIHKLSNRIPNIKLLLVGAGGLLNQYEQQVIKLGIKDKVEFLGFRNDVSKLMGLSDIAVSSSKQEGLPVNIMEAMATGLPLVVTDCRGNRDLVKNRINGFVVGINDIDDFASKVEELYLDNELRQIFSQENLKFVNRYTMEKVMPVMETVYKSIQ